MKLNNSVGKQNHSPFLPKLKDMIKFDELPKYKAQRTFLDYIIYLEFKDGVGTWSVWDTVEYDELAEIDPRLVYGDEERGFLVRDDLLNSGSYTKRVEAIAAAKAFILAYEASFVEEGTLAEAA